MIIGIDPGREGALCLMGRKAEILDVCVMPDGVSGVFDVLNEWKERCEDAALFCCLEQVASRPMQGVVSVFTFGTHYGSILGILAALRIAHEMVRPQVWQKTFWGKTSDPKASALEACRRLYPSQELLATTRSKKAHSGIVDCVLIARHCWERRRCPNP